MPQGFISAVYNLHKAAVVVTTVKGLAGVGR